MAGTWNVNPPHVRRALRDGARNGLGRGSVTGEDGDAGESAKSQ